MTDPPFRAGAAPFLAVAATLTWHRQADGETYAAVTVTLANPSPTPAYVAWVNAELDQLSPLSAAEREEVGRHGGARAYLPLLGEGRVAYPAPLGLQPGETETEVMLVRIADLGPAPAAVVLYVHAESAVAGQRGWATQVELAGPGEEY